MKRSKKSSKVDANNFQAAKCKTCPFREGSIFNKDSNLVAKLCKRVIQTANHICHTDDTKICRGGRDYQLDIFTRLGVIDAPTDAAWAAKLEEVSKNGK